MSTNEVSNQSKGGLKKYIYMPPQRSLISELLQKQLEMEKAEKESRPCQKDSSYFSIDLQLADSRESQSISTATESCSHDSCGINTAQSPTIRTAKSPQLSDLDVYDGALRLTSEKSESIELPSEIKNSNIQDALSIFAWNQRKKKGNETKPSYKDSDYCFNHYKS